jgi:ATPase subunit of ABC transporter with duplicated ATPase domains
MAERNVFALERLTKSYQGKKPVLKDISLVFLERAKIGVIGQNGAGKSTLLRIMAGQDKEYDGVARLADGKTVGYVPQEPKLLEDLTVREQRGAGGGADPHAAEANMKSSASSSVKTCRRRTWTRSWRISSVCSTRSKPRMRGRSIVTSRRR